MSGHDEQGPRPEAAHLLLYDGECGFCSRLVQAVLERDQRGVFHFASLQSSVAATELARFGGRPESLDTFVVIGNYRGTASTHATRARAALFVLTALGWPWRMAAALGVLPVAILDRAYDLVARNRHRLLGRGDRCVVLRPEQRGRFLDRGETLPPEVHR